MTRFGLLISLLAGVLLASCGQQRSDDHALSKKEHVTLTVSAASSLKEALEAVKADYQTDHPEIELTFNYGPSGTLQKQIEQGADVDLFLSAGTSQMKALEKQSLVQESTTLLQNELVLIVPADQKYPAGNLTGLQEEGVHSIAIGQPETVPAGMYARQTLEHAGLWEQLSGRLVYAKDVRQVLSYVESGNADAGFVYRTDSLGSDKVNIVLSIDAADHEPIEYPVGIISGTGHLDAAGSFYRYLQGEDATAIFNRFGFKTP